MAGNPAIGWEFTTELADSDEFFRMANSSILKFQRCCLNKVDLKKKSIWNDCSLLLAATAMIYSWVLRMVAVQNVGLWIPGSFSCLRIIEQVASGRCIKTWRQPESQHLLARSDPQVSVRDHQNPTPYHVPTQWCPHYKSWSLSNLSFLAQITNPLVN